MKNYRVNIDGMTCEHCAATVSAALRALPGVRDVTVDLTSKHALVAIDEQRGGVAELMDAVHAAGFSVRAFGETSPARS